MCLQHWRPLNRLLIHAQTLSSRAHDDIWGLRVRVFTYWTGLVPWRRRSHENVDPARTTASAPDLKAIFGLIAVNAVKTSPLLFLAWSLPACSYEFYAEPDVFKSEKGTEDAFYSPSCGVGPYRACHFAASATSNVSPKYDGVYPGCNSNAGN